MQENTHDTYIYPLYDFITTPDKVLLGHIHVTVTVDTESEQTFAPVYLRLLPVPLLVLEYTHSGHPGIYKDKLLSSNIVKKVESQHILNARYIDRYIQPNSGYVVSQWQVNEPLLNINTTNELKEIIFHLLNFDIFHSPTQFVESRRIGIKNEPEPIHIIDLKSDNWHIELSSIYETRTHVNHIRQHPELRLTHMGRIRRAQSETFAIAEGQELIETLNSMFSFALGYNYTLVCPVGSDSNGKRWHSYNAPLRSRYKRQNWYDAHHISNELKQQLELLFPLFIKKYDEPDWRNTLRSIIYWYTTANQAQELEVAVVAIMSAFEKVIPRFSKLVKIDKRPGTTVENLNRILKYQHVAIDIPSSFRDIRIQINDYKDVHKNEPKYKDITSMIHLLAEARNSYIHEHYKLSRPLTSAEVLTLIEYGLEMIELLILSICAYQGKYVSRVIHKGTLVDVPWQNAATTS